MIRYAFFAFAIIGLFLFPWPYTAFLALVSSFYLPPFGLAFGIVADTLYWTHGTGFPLATLAGAIGSVIGFIGNRFFKNRIADLTYL